MTDFGSAATVGGRIQALRRARGLRTAKDLADAIGGSITESIIENIEMGRKSTLDVSQLLNIAMALQVPPSFLLAPMNDPLGTLDLPNLSSAFDGMTAIEFDSWLSALPDGVYYPTSFDERTTGMEVNSLRAWAALRAEVPRLEVMLAMESSVIGDDSSIYVRSTAERLANARRDLERLTAMLNSAGWELPEASRKEA